MADKTTILAGSFKNPNTRRVISDVSVGDLVARIVRLEVSYRDLAGMRERVARLEAQAYRVRVLAGALGAVGLGSAAGLLWVLQP